MVMNKYKTAAFEVENEVQKVITGNEISTCTWQFINCIPVTRTLDCTEKELEKLVLLDARQRPGFEKCEDTIYIPNLFVKLSGQTNSEIIIAEDNYNSAIFNSLGEFSAISRCEDENETVMNSKINNLFNSEGLLDASKVFSSELYQYAFLRKEYQEIVIQKINFIIKNKNIIFTDRVKDSDPSYIADVLLRINAEIMQMFNGFDFQNTIPKIIIHNNTTKDKLLDEQAFVLALLNQLGFDIIIQSTEGFADIENVLGNNIYSIFYHPIAKEQNNKKNKNIISRTFKNKLYLGAASVLISFAMLFGGISLVRDYQKSKVEIVVPDEIKILKVTPVGAVKAGVITEFKVEVQYNLKDADTAFLNIGANDGIGSRYFRDGVYDPNVKYYIKSSARISKGSNKYTFTIKATPKIQEEKFKLSAAIVNPSSDGSGRVFARDFFPIEVEK